MLDKRKIQYIFFFALIGATAILSFFVFRPYLLTLFLAVVLGIVLDPVYLWLRKALWKKRRLAAVATILVAILVIAIPLSFFLYRIFLEAQDLYASLSLQTQSGSFLDELGSSSELLRSIKDSFSQELGSLAQRALNFFITNIGAVFSSVASLFLNLFLLLFALYYVLSNREKLHEFIKEASPLENEHDESIIKKMRAACNSVIRGNLAVALVQGIVASIGFSIFGVPNPMIWGGVAAIAALVPTVGTTLVTAPAIIYLFLTGNTAEGVGLLIWSATAVGLIDNILGPILIDRGIRLHPFMILLAVLGGLSLFGPIGFILGPVILAFLVALIDTYSAFTKQKEAGIES